MCSIRYKETKMEVFVSKRLWKHGIRFRKNVKNMYGKPDIAIKKYKIAIFLDSCFWHKCPIHYKHPKSNNAYWDQKIERNVLRDKEVNLYYTKHGWHILRIWEHEFKTKALREKAVEKIISFIKTYKIINN